MRLMCTNGSSPSASRRTPLLSIVFAEGAWWLILGSVAPNPSETSTSTIQRVLAYALLGVVIISVGSFFAIMIGTWTGMSQADFGTGLWPVVAMTPYIGLPLAMLVLIALLIAGAIGRSRAARGQ